MENNNQNTTPNPSPAVIKRLPRYYRYLRELITQGKMRISSGELSAMMGSCGQNALRYRNKHSVGNIF